MDRFLGLMDPEIEFRSVFERKTYRGLAGMVQWTEDLDATIDELHSEDDRFLEAGEDRVVYLYRIVGTGTGSGVPVSRKFAILWRLRDGKLFKGEVYLDQTLALQAPGCRSSSNRRWTIFGSRKSALRDRPAQYIERSASRLAR